MKRVFRKPIQTKPINPKGSSDAGIIRPFKQYIFAEPALLDGHKGKPYVFSTDCTKAFVIADLHFDDRIIWSLCRKKFASLEAMNDALVRNWNSVVTDYDIVFLLGDITRIDNSYLYLYWLQQLKGQKVIIKGNHDVAVRGCCTRALLEYNGRRFLLVHEPKRGKEFNGWVLHGHRHLTDCKEHPFIHGGRKTINVCAELVGYTPIALDEVVRLANGRVYEQESIDSRPKLKKGKQ